MSIDQPQFVDLAIAAHPKLAQAVALHKDGRLDDAASIYLAILKESPQEFDALHLLGVAALQQGRFNVAQHFINGALSVNPHSAVAMGNLGTSYLRDGQFQSALQWFDIALKLAPDSFDALINAGTALHHMGRYAEAIPLLRRARAADCASYTVCNLLGACLIKTGETREAVEMFDAATRADPDNAESWANLSIASYAIGDQARARDCADRAVTLKPQSSTAYHALGTAQFDQGRIAEAIESYRQGVALSAPSADMLFAFGNALLASGLNEEAIDQLQRAVQLDEKNLRARWAIAIAYLKPIYKSEADLTQSRQNFSNAIDEVAAWYRTADGVSEPFGAVGVSQPFFLAYQPLNNRELLTRYGALCASWMTTLPAQSADAGAAADDSIPLPAVSRKLRIGIVAAHMHEHSVWNAITRGWVHHLDREKFDLYLFQLNPTSDQETEIARPMATHFEDRPTSLQAWITAIRSQRLDAVIYPEVGMDPLTVQLASLRLAPVQAASWGHPETTGLPTLDLYLSSYAFEPLDAPNNYSETVVRLPNLGVYVEPLAPKITKPGLRSLNLPTNEPLLLCPGAPFKYTPAYDDVWVQIAKRLERKFLRSSGGRLVFFRSRSESMDRLLETRLRTAFDKGGVDFNAHVSIIPTLDRSRFFGLMHKSALMLDTLGFSGFNTALQAIECGLPVLAFEGDFMRGRLASGILRQLDLSDLIATSTADFVQKAVDLANNARRRKRLQIVIKERRATLFRDMTTIRALERHLADAVNHVSKR